MTQPKQTVTTTCAAAVVLGAFVIVGAVCRSMWGEVVRGLYRIPAPKEWPALRRAILKEVDRSGRGLGIVDAICATSYGALNAVGLRTWDGLRVAVLVRWDEITKADAPGIAKDLIEAVKVNEWTGTAAAA